MPTVEFGGKTFTVDEDGFIDAFDNWCPEWVQHVKNEEGIDEKRSSEERRSAHRDPCPCGGNYLDLSLVDSAMRQWEPEYQPDGTVGSRGSENPLHVPAAFCEHHPRSGK